MSDLLSRVTDAIQKAREAGGSDEDLAKAAIQEVRKPTPVMLFAMATDEDRDGTTNPSSAFTAAIDAGLHGHSGWPG